MAGSDGSGKSTLVRIIRAEYSNGHWIDFDEIADQVRQERRLDEITREVFDEARRRACNQRVDYAIGLADFCFETVFSHGLNLAFLRALKLIGYEVELFFVGTENPSINVGRVRNRMELRGQAMLEGQEEEIRMGHKDALELLSLSIRDCDGVILYDNSINFRAAAPPNNVGRVAAEILGEFENYRRENVILHPPLPNWVFRYGVFPYSKEWPTSQACQDARALFGDKIVCDIPDDANSLGSQFALRSRIKFLNRFRVETADPASGF